MTKKQNLYRKSLFDDLPMDTEENLYCRLEDLSNESSVETFFVNRLIADLGYKDHQIKTKKSISAVAVSLGSRTINYKPDYVLTLSDVPRWVIDAKATSERLEKWVAQCSGYCLTINQQYEKDNPVQFFMLTNGVKTQVFRWDVDKPIFELAFSDFSVGNPKFEQLRALLSEQSLPSTQSKATVQNDFALKRPAAEQAKAVFAQCHNVIWKSEGLSPTAAFMEFTKLMFVKLWADRKLRTDEKLAAVLDKDANVKVPKTSVVFSTHWIEANSQVAENPVNDILFKKLRDDIERDIHARKKKRIFAADEVIDLRPHTIKEVVRRLEHYDMFGIDEDLNGRLFETFLSATMRGRELGQYFTPRSVVKLMVRMADLQATRTQMDKVIDACCGTGGFLIEALAEMRNKIRNNQSLTASERDELFERLANESIYGIDFGKSPPIAQIARINMYLHGDGGSRIYYADALDKNFDQVLSAEFEVLENQNELKAALESGLRFRAALTNPPFSMTKELKNESEALILKRYDLAKQEGTSKFRPSLRSSAMFIERYYDLLEPRGLLFTVIDDTLLSGAKFKSVRDFIRQRFIVRAIISLPADAFRRSGARVKTSVLCLEKKVNLSDQQTNVFYAFCEYLGIDDLTPRASSNDVAVARKAAEDEIAKVVADFQRFLKGEKVTQVIPPDRILDRLDLKFAVPLQGRYVSQWKEQGIEVKGINEVATLTENSITPKAYPDDDFKLIYVTYDGICKIQRTQKGKHIKPAKMLKVNTGDLIFSKIRATDGAIGIVPPELDGALVSESFLVLRCPTEKDTIYLWTILRSYEIRADLMSPSTGTGRYTVEWDRVGGIQIAWLDKDKRWAIADKFIAAWELGKQMFQLQQQAMEIVAPLGVESDESKKRYEAYRPPK